MAHRRHGLTRGGRAALAGLAILGTAILGAGAVRAGGAASPTENVAAANPKATGFAEPNTLTPRLIGYRVGQVVVARGSNPTENPLETVGGVLVTRYGYLGDGPSVPAPGSVQSPGHNVEATKTEPDKNTYLVLRDQHGPDAHYDYGTRFLFQGHENGLSDGGIRRGSITRVNLDADAAHRVTVMATRDSSGAFLQTIDGSTWDPFAGVLLFTAENGSNGAVYQMTPDYPPVVTDVSGVLGRAGWEGIQTDSDGNLWLVEDTGGPSGAVNNRARQPNSFVYRFVPRNRFDLLSGGRLQVLRVASRAVPGSFIAFHAGMADADILSRDMKDLHTYGLTFATGWVTVHDTAVDGFAPFDANAKAKAAGGSPFKRPENGVFRPDTRFRDFYFTETGDTNADTQAGSAYGGFGAVFLLTQNSPSAASGLLTLFYRGDVGHSGLDNLAFLTGDDLIVGEDAGDGLHTQRNALDSLWLLDADRDYGHGGDPIRILAEGRDASATVDSALSAGGGGFQNDGDNETTGIHVSDGDPTIQGLLGARSPRPFRDRDWRVFWTQQHGDNVTWEIVALCGDGPDADCGRGNDDRDHGRGHDR